MKLKKVSKKIMWILGIVVAIWLIGDFGYSRYVASKLSNWEKTIQRDEDGVMSGCQEYSVGSGPTAILLVHGINDTPFCWRKMAPELAKSFHVRAMRMPGFGEPIPDYASTNAEDWIAAVRAEANLLRKNHQQVFVVAHSLGGAVTIQTVLQTDPDTPELFDGIILLAPAIKVSNRRSPLLPTRAWHSIAGALIFTRITYNPFGNDAQDPKEKNSANRVPFTPRTVVDETFKLIDANDGRESEIDTPVLLVLSDQDQVNDHQASVKWLDLVSSKRKEIFWNNRSGHALQYDLGWETVTEKIKEFIQP